MKRASIAITTLLLLGACANDTDTVVADYGLSDRDDADRDDALHTDAAHAEAGHDEAGHADGWADLFNGEDLTGWVSTGAPDAWGVDGGEIITVKPGTGGWLRTDRMYRDFEMTVDFFMPEGGNSGLGLRGTASGDPAFTGFEIQMYDTFGQEPTVHNCGAVYEAIAPDAMPVKEAGNWNTYRVSLVGDTLDVWLNGVKIHDGEKIDGRGYFRQPEQSLPLNERVTTGYIAVQDHGHAFRYRNVRIKDLSPDPEPAGMAHLITPDLEHWFAEDLGAWTYENGALIGRGGPGHFFTKDTFADFEMRSFVKVNARGNSGIYFRTVPHPDPNMPWPITQGFEAQVDQHDPKNYTGVIYNLAWPETSPGSTGPITSDDVWFDYRIRAVGNHIQTWINGVLFVDAELDGADTGHLALQGHHPGNVIIYKDLRVIELD